MASAAQALSPDLAKLIERFPEVQPYQGPAQDGWPTAVVPAERLGEVCAWLRDEPGLRFVFLADLCAVHWPKRPQPFELNYLLHSFQHNRRLRLKVWVGGDPPTVPSVTGVWRTANYMEREAYDLLGIIFTGHPDLRRILMPPDWEGHPLRKDFPLGEEPIEFWRADLPEGRKE